MTTEPTYAGEGVKTYTCTACGATKTEVIPKRNMEYTVGSTYQDISTNAIYRITVINQQGEYVCPIVKKLKKATIPSQIRLGTLLIGPPKSIQPSAPIMKPYRTFALLSRPVMKFVKASVAQTIGVPITKYISNPPRIADKVGMIIIGIKASAQ